MRPSLCSTLQTFGTYFGKLLVECAGGGGGAQREFLFWNAISWCSCLPVLVSSGAVPCVQFNY